MAATMPASASTPLRRPEVSRWLALKRYGINPSFGTDFNTPIARNLSYERFHDERVADRGVPSLGGRLFDVDPSTFFGNAKQSPVEATVDAFAAVIDHDFGNGLSLRNHLRYADYDKSYQCSRARSTPAQTVAISPTTTPPSAEPVQPDRPWCEDDGGGMPHTGAGRRRVRSPGKPTTCA